MSDEDVKFKFSLDAKDALGQMDAMTGKIQGLGDAKNLSGLIDGFRNLAGPIFIAGAALLAVKKALDLTMEGESILKVHKTFEALSEQAGLSSTSIESGMKKATRGMVDTEDAIKSANKSIIQLGANASHIPEIMDLGRRAGKIFGVETLEAFEAISQTIATGSTRQLRQIGIIVDANKSYREYARSIGVTTGQLSEQGKQTALMNAILAKGNDKFKDVAGSSETLTANSKKLSIELKELGDTVAVLAAKSFGGFFASVTSGLTSLAAQVNISLKSSFGTGAEKIEADTEIIKQNIDSLKKEMQKLETVGSSGSNSYKLYAEQIEKLETQLNQFAEAEEKAELKKIARQTAKVEAAGGNPVAKENGDVNNEEKKLADAKFNRELLAIKEARLKSGMDVETNALMFTQMLGEEEVLIVQQYNAKIQEIKAKGDKGDELTKQQAAEEIIQIEEEKKNKIIEFERQKEDASLKVYENQVKAAKTSSEGIAAGFKQQGMIAKKESQDYGKQGVAAFNMVNTGAKKFFVGLGEGSKDASQLMKEFLFGVLADYAEQSGAVMLAEGIGTYDGVKVAEGGALLALSGLIRGLAGGGGGGGSSSSGGGGGAGSAPGPATGLEKPHLDETQKKSVTIQVQGNYFETEQTKTRITEMIRETSDATDYKFQQIGVK